MRGLIVYKRSDDPLGIDAIDEYSRRLTAALDAAGTPARYVASGLGPAAVEANGAPWILLQYNPFRFGRSGFAPRMIRDAMRLRRRSRAPLVVMVHEAWIDMVDAKSTAIGLWQRAQLRVLLSLADVVITSTEALARELGKGATHIPVASNITRAQATGEEARRRLGLDGRLVVALFGRGHPSRGLDYAESAISALAEAHGAERLTILNLGAGAPELALPPGAQLVTPGRLQDEELSIRLTAADLALLPFADGLSTRRTTLMAALAHGLPVVGLRGRNTDAVLSEAADALSLTPVGDRDAYARAAVELAADPQRMRASGLAARRLYEGKFDWPVLARRVGASLEGARAARAASSIVFVGHDIGGSGGMEHHTEELIGGLLAAGEIVTVVARTCRLEPHPRLRFVRVATPARPFPIAFPAFFVLASFLLARRTRGLIHATGAIVANRTDIATVHYCHSAAAKAMRGPRASQHRLAFAVNAWLASVISRLGERWCYRPRRTTILAPVSSGVAAELEQYFPSMSSRVRTVPNGVDAARFKPDPRARDATRAELGIDQETRLALFVGGDWERKGLVHAVDALAHAPRWRLAVAGPGDQAPLLERAEASGVVERLHFLGRVSEMPPLYASADAFVLPTAYEAFPLVALEAAAAGLPLLITSVNGAQELLADGRAGWFIAQDGPDIARRLNELSDDPELARAMGVAARAAGERYSWTAMTERYLELYEELRTASPAS